jgi:hypothetical protein
MTTAQTYIKNIKLIYGYSFFQMFLVCIPLLVPYWKNLGLNISEVFLLQGIFDAVLGVVSQKLVEESGRAKAVYEFLQV